MRILLAFLKGLLLRLFPSMGPRGVVETQITMYQRLKRRFPAAAENDLLNSLIISRVNAPLSPSAVSEERAHYEPLLQNQDKTLEDVIWAIVEYEYILSRSEELQRELLQISAEPSAIIEELEEWKGYIRKRIAEIT